MIMSCKKCNSNRVAEVGAKCSDMFNVNLGDSTHEGYVPKDLGIGGGDYVEFEFCLDCGQLQGNFPLPPAQIEKDISDEEVVEFFDNHFVEGEKCINLSSSDRRSIIDHAEKISSKFGFFVQNYIDNNMNHSYLNHQHRVMRLHPSVNKFVQMFRERNFYL
jgi:hypothetical protein